MMWLAAECKRAYMVPHSSICYCHHFEHLFLLDQIHFKVCVLMLFLLVVTLTQIFYIYSLFGQFYSYAGAKRIGGGIIMLMVVYGSESFIYFNFI